MYDAIILSMGMVMFLAFLGYAELCEKM